ncbi:hypothetical protein TSTA_044450 [Talaromyces stipitatus ATCC 10500]|uniref:Uncharacterized protein n=1 Tax=Talaromyces stipitatus (strain ATCC 10500 / CBS 375.48 / QM 6759 / NRRL 1006) TaxID=441959 RepID=B8ML64_TALSN|nr:uncharacterized protein TSTA_044450 [Talaromyces stipitatus ATCC 10500]EED14979.1 hypothetical protein TSTA_044450 [Talaromyces stipitatus ATCC 10500]
MTSSNFVTKEELKWLFAEVLGIQNAQTTLAGKEPISKKKIEDKTTIEREFVPRRWNTRRSMKYEIPQDVNTRLSTLPEFGTWMN